MADQWYYALGGMHHGPFEMAYIQDLVTWGKIDPATLVWQEGMAQWTAIAQIPEFGVAAPQYQSPAQGYGGSGPYQLAYGGYQSDGGSAWPDSVYAGFWIRFLAYFVDGLILAIPTGICNGLQSAIDSAVGNGTPTAALLSLSIVVSILPLVMDWLYFAGMESSSSQGTFGKMICGLIVTDLQGRRLSFGRASGRYFAKILSCLTLFIGYIMVGMDVQKRALHDRIAGTFVVKRSMVPRRGR